MSTVGGGQVPRLIASDLDGTFLSPDGSISEVNARAVELAREAGIHFVFATGRPPRWLDVLNTLPADERRVICSNGALVFDLSSQEFLISHPIPVDELQRTIAVIRELAPQVAFAVEQGFSVGVEDHFIRDMRAAERIRRVTVAPAERLIESGPVLKLLAQHPTITSDEFHTLVEGALAELVTVTHSSFGRRGLLEISALGVSKASTLAEYSRRLGIAPAEVAAFGDMPNDAQMLAWAGHPHVMEHAHHSLDVLDATRIGSNADSAVGRAILAWLGER